MVDGGGDRRSAGSLAAAVGGGRRGGGGARGRLGRPETPALVALPAEGAALGEARAPARRLAQDGGAGPADDDRLRVREDGRDVEAPLALDVHEERVGRLHQPLELVRA